MMKIYNTLTMKKEEFIPIEKNKVRMYVCGPTVYDYIHIGNARPMVVFDSFRRYLEFCGYEVNFVSNFTDIDDKIIKKAIETNSTQQEVSKKFIDECLKDMKELNIKKASKNPLATEEIDGMISLITELKNKGYAYQVEDGTVYFDTSKDKDYGKLSHKNIDELRSGEREIKITGEENKKNTTDFVLWKPKKEGEPYWESPFCKGRPGWHTECCVMAKKYCERLDIHAGGEDLIFPHHENEIAQYEAIYDHTYAKYWMHNAFLNINNKKMSKSLGNFLTVRKILEKTNGRVLRFLLLLTHYRLMLNFSIEDNQTNSINQAKAGLLRIDNLLNNILFILKNKNKDIDAREIKNKDEFLQYVNGENNLLTNEKEKEIINDILIKIKNFFEKLDDDFNTPDAITSIFDIVLLVNKNINEENSIEYLTLVYNILNILLSVLGLEIKNDNNELLDEKIEQLIEERNIARKNKDFKKADEIRDLLLSKGIELEDTRMGVKWKRI